MINFFLHLVICPEFIRHKISYKTLKKKTMMWIDHYLLLSRDTKCCSQSRNEYRLFRFKFTKIIHISLKCNHALHLSPLCPMVSPVENSATAGNCKMITEWNLMKPCYSWGDHTLINLTLLLTEKHAGHENKLHYPYGTSRVVFCE